jgi:D-erythro-7,8-dihydroneopterin triphosphate epimerase
LFHPRITLPEGKETAEMITGIATIKITNLRLRTYIGFNPEERSKQQDVVINAEIRHRIQPGALRDEVDAALNYKVITKAMIRHVEEGRFLLLEKLVNDLLEICSAEPEVVHALVRVDKPHALRFADSVSLTLEYDRQQAQKSSENPHANYPRPLSQAS